MFDEIESIIISALFVSQNPLKVHELYNVLNNKNSSKKLTKDHIESLLLSIDKKFKENNLPFSIRKLPNESYDLTIREAYLKYVEHLAPYKDFSRATLQTLALIAYRSPIKQKEVVRIRGHRAYEQIKELINRGFVSVEKVGNYNVLRITKKFLRYFGLKNENELREFFAKRDIKEEDFDSGSDSI